MAEQENKVTTKQNGKTNELCRIKFSNDPENGFQIFIQSNHSFAFLAGAKADTWKLGGVDCMFPRQGSGSNLAAIYCRSTGKLAMYCTATGPTSIAYDPGSNTLSAGTWYYVTLTYTGTANAGIKGYINAATADGGVNSTLNLIGTVANTNIGRDPNTSGSFFNGSIDEARIASVARSPDWITTEYNNEFAPGTFETLGTEVAFVAPTSSNMFLLFP